MLSLQAQPDISQVLKWNRLDPVGKEDADVDNDGKKNEAMISTS